MQFIFILFLSYFMMTPAILANHNYRQSGIASWYGPGFEGKKMANGHIYRQNGNSCAHRTLPLGTRIKVTNLHNKKASYTIVTDRGPYHGNRILDMSRGLKNKIGCPDLCYVSINR